MKKIKYILLMSALLSLSSSGAFADITNRARSAFTTLPVSVQSAGYMNQLQSYDEAFFNSETYMSLPYKVRMEYRGENQNSVSEPENPYGLHVKNPMGEGYSYQEKLADKNSIWVRPYVSTGSVNFKNGPKVDNTMYGVYIGSDSKIKHLKKADFQYSAYMGYNGTHQSFGENSIYSNGGLFGVTGTWYGKKAFTSLTVNAGGSNSELSTFYTTKNYPLFSTGIASKTGYNFEFADGKFIMQPSFLVSYSFVTPFVNGHIAGIDIQKEPFHAINMSPGIKFIGNLKHGWQPYAEARMVWNILGKTDYNTTFVDVPSIGIKPYAQYGFGIQKLWGERLTGFLQFMMRSGGRNDVAFGGGLKFLVGKDPDKI